MMHSRKHSLLLILVLGLAGLILLGSVPFAAPAYAAPGSELDFKPDSEDRVIAGESFVLHEGEHMMGDLVIFGGSLTMERDSHLEGSLTAFGGRVDVDGTLTGEMVVFGGAVTLGPHARVTGEVVALGGNVRRAEEARVGRLVQAPELPSQFWTHLRVPSLAPRFSLMGAMVGAVVLALLTLAIVTLWPAQTDRVGQTILAAPVPSLGVGCLIYPAAASLTFIVLISICLAPFSPLVILLVVAAALLGWVALGTLWGRWLVRRMSWSGITSTAAAAIGVFTLTLLVTLLGAVPIFGVLLVLGASSIGLGAVALTRFGTSRYPKRPEAELPPRVDTNAPPDRP